MKPLSKKILPLIVFFLFGSCSTENTGPAPDPVPTPVHRDYLEDPTAYEMIWRDDFDVLNPANWTIGLKAASTMDILPTLIDAAGGSVPEEIDGRSLLPLISGQSQAPVHDHLVWAGLHARAWGFLLNTSYKTHGTERNHAPPAWVVVKKPYLLRYVGTIEPEVYQEEPLGGPPVYELFNYLDDPAETRNLAEEMPEKVAELRAIYAEEANTFPPPFVWDKRKWEEIRGENFDGGLKK